MDLPAKHALYLSKRIGARGPGTDGEAAASSYILRAMGNSGAEVNIETFSCWKSDLDALMILYFAAVAGFLLMRVSYTASLVTLILVFFVFQMETYSWAVLSRLLPRSQASNVIARIPASGELKRRVVITANYDTPKSSPLGRPGIARIYRLLYIVAFICITLLVVLGIGSTGASLTHVSRSVLDTVWLYCTPLPAYLLFMGLLIAWGGIRGEYTPGANDNASGVGVLLSTVERLVEHPLEDTEVWGVATARGSAGGRGMVNLLRRHGFKLKDAYFINVDHVSNDELRIITREGVMLGFRNSGRLKRMAFQAAVRSKEFRKIRKGRCRVKKSDAMAATVRSYRAITIGGLRGGTYSGFRNQADTNDRIERAVIDRAFKLLGIVLDEIDAEGTRRRPGRVEEQEGPAERVRATETDEPPSEEAIAEELASSRRRRARERNSRRRARSGEQESDETG